MIPRSIAAAQTVPVGGDVEANLRQHLTLIRVAADLDARVLVFPELSLTGYELALGHVLAFSERDPASGRWSRQHRNTSSQSWRARR